MKVFCTTKRQQRQFEMFKVFLENCSICKKGQVSFIVSKEYVVINKAHWLKITSQLAEIKKAV